VRPVLENDLPAGDIAGIGFYILLPSVDGGLRLDEIEIYAEAVSGSVDVFWAGYPIVKQGDRDWIDTNPWMGWLDVTAAPWVYSNSLDAWTYLSEDEAISESGGWMYLIK